MVKYQACVTIVNNAALYTVCDSSRFSADEKSIITEKLFLPANVILECVRHAREKGFLRYTIVTDLTVAREGLEP